MKASPTQQFPSNVVLLEPTTAVRPEKATEYPKSTAVAVGSRNAVCETIDSEVGALIEGAALARGTAFNAVPRSSAPANAVVEAMRLSLRRKRA
jgi:hypothetical protein